MARRYLLSIDGGGVRGLIPAIALAKLENTTGRPARDTFSFVAGTSTGALIAAAIAAGIPATRMVDLYVNRANEVFKKVSLLARLRQVFTGSLHSTDKLYNIVVEELGPVARHWKLNNSPIDLLITAKGVPNGTAWYFVKDNDKNHRSTGHLRLADCITGSAAAPTFFKPWKIDARIGGSSERVGAVIDGGVGVAGNPVYQACVEAFCYSEGYEPENTLTVSLGTGRFLDKKMPAWLWPCLKWSIDELLESPGEQQTEIVWRHFREMPLYRIDTVLNEPIELDEAKAVGRLREYGEELAKRIDWQAILDGTDKVFRVSEKQKRFPKYAKKVV